ncbi:MAG: response regulator transcription factor [Gemmatimonadota bacterium]|nr:MAG: response regulator transcription factor [Gemmatimonadota bacterium]
MSSERVKVLVVDDHAVVREGIRHVLSEDAGFKVVAEAANGAEAMTLVETCRPDVVVLDINMPSESGLDVAARLRSVLPDVRILILSMHDQSEYVLQAVRAGASGYVLKDTDPAELRDAVKTVNAGNQYFSSDVASRLSAALRGEVVAEQQRSRLDLLTARERDVLGLVADGRTNKEIGVTLGISPRTVETHRESIVRKLEIKTVAGLTRFAIETGLASDQAE